VGQLVRGEGNCDLGLCWASGGGRVALYIPLPFFLSVLLSLVFASFAVLLNCPYPDPQVLPFSSNSPPHPSGGTGDRATAWSFVAGWGQTTTSIMGPDQVTSRDEQSLSIFLFAKDVFHKSETETQLQNLDLSQTVSGMEWLARCSVPSLQDLLSG